MFKPLKYFLGKLIGRKLVMSHVEDADGIASAAIALRKYRNALLYLTTPAHLNKAGKYSWINLIGWDIVCDLPCPARTFLWVDHHKTNVSRAKKAFHDPEAPCAAILLLKALNLEEDPIARKLAELAVQTDTANITTQEAWDLNDAVKGSPTHEREWLAKQLALKGLEALKDSKVAYWIRRNREVRERTFNLAEKLDPYPVMIVVFPEQTERFSHRALILNLEKKGARVVAVLMSRNGVKWRVSLGRGDEEIDCSEYAAKLGGGGHPAAAGATVRMSLNELIEKLLEMFPRDKVAIYQVDSKLEVASLKIINPK